MNSNPTYKSKSWRGVTYSHWHPADGKACATSLTLGTHLFFHAGYSDTNHHGEKYEDPSPCGYSYKTIKGWKFTRLRLKHASAGATYRFILYYPTGKWRHWDVSITVSRKYKTTKGFLRGVIRKINIQLD